MVRENLEGMGDRAATSYLRMAIISGRCELDSAHCAYLLVPTSRVLDAFCQVVVSADTRIRRVILVVETFEIVRSKCLLSTNIY